MIIDFHTHTHHSFDSMMKPAKILRLAKQRGLNGIVICDHNTIKGGLEAQKLNQDPTFHVIVGAEIATNAGDITGIFLTKEIRSRKVDEVIEEIKSQGGKVILNHPYYGHDLSKIDYSKLDFIEGYNARLTAKQNVQAIELAKKHEIPVIGGSDAHLYNEIANCSTEVTDLQTLQPLKTQCRYSSKLNYVFSQYIKAWKKKRISIFVSASAILTKHLLSGKWKV